MVNDSIIPLRLFNSISLIFFLSLELSINEIKSKKACLNPSLITKFLSKFISNGLDISIPSILKDLAKILSVEKKYIFRDRTKKKMYNFLDFNKHNILE